MILNKVNGSAFVEHTDVKCATDDKIYFVQDGKLRWYPSADIYKRNGGSRVDIVPCELIKTAQKGSDIQFAKPARFA